MTYPDQYGMMQIAIKEYNGPNKLLYKGQCVNKCKIM